ncbi:MAG: hypothetical protein LAP86_28640 [Acidobacteriia bacterium]|nr:hypothetical protein [Terriglobia bacterium]
MAGLMGGVSRQTCAATFPPDRFYCLLDELPLHLVPRSALAVKSQDGGRDVFLNPECRLCVGEKLPEELASQKELVSAFALQGTVAWVRDANTSSLMPFWLGPKLESIVWNLRLQEPIPESVPAFSRSILKSAGILVSADSIGHRRTEREEALGRAAELFQKKGYAPLRGLIHPFHIAALRRYYRSLIRTGRIPLGDGQSSRRYAAYNDPVARFFHWQIAFSLSSVAGEPVKPSYVYLASYLSGAELKKHVDREQCEFSITLCLDFSPEPILATPWPIQLDAPTGTVTVYQALGDGLAYRGTRLPHYRSPLGSGQTSTSIFFHYVAADFAGSLD